MKISFGSVTPIIAKNQQVLDRLGANITQKAGRDGWGINNLTDAYKNNGGDGLLTQAARDGKQVGFVVCGEERRAQRFMDHGWGAELAPTRHIDRDAVEISSASAARKAAKTLAARVNSEKV